MKTPPPAPAGRLKILAIDDEPVIRDFIKIVLSQLYEVTTACSGIEGIRLAKSEKPDLILLDILMPGHDGFACLQELRASPETARVPVLMVTAVSDSDVRLQAFHAGADDFITKPFRPEELLRRIETKIETLRMPSNVTPLLLQLGDVVLDLATASVRAGKEVLQLDPAEFKILSLLLRRRGRLAHLKELENTVWPARKPDEANLEPLMRSLRGKLQYSALALQTVYGAGYALTVKSDGR